jgi:hypothetical protein
VAGNSGERCDGWKAVVARAKQCPPSGRGKVLRTKEIRSSRKKMLLYLAGRLGFVTSGAFLIRDSCENNLPLWASLAFFALCSVVFVWLLIRPPRLIVDGTGFLVAGGFVSSPKKVLWREIDGFSSIAFPGRQDDRLQLQA